MSHPILKKDDELTAADFVASMVWVNVHGVDEGEPWYHRCDETTFRPFAGNLPVDPTDYLYLIASQMTLADGVVFPGAIYGTAEKIRSEAGFSQLMGDLQPRVFVNEHTIRFWGGYSGIPIDERKIFAESIGKSVESIFPITFRALVGCTTGVTAGTIEGFYKLSDDEEAGKRSVLIEHSLKTDTSWQSRSLGSRVVISPTHLASQGRFDDALEMLDELISTDPNNAKNWEERSAVNRWKGDIVAAAADALASVECEPWNGELYPWLCRLKNEAGMFSDCLHYARIGLASKFDEPTTAAFLKGEITFHLARALLETGNPQQAMALLDTFPPGYGIAGASRNDRMARRSGLLAACKVRIRKIEQGKTRNGQTE